MVHDRGEDKTNMPPKVVSDGKRVLLESDVAGDEPYMLAHNLPGVVVLIDKDRVKAGRYAIEKFGAEVLILDDGFQYLPIKSGYEPFARRSDESLWE